MKNYEYKCVPVPSMINTGQKGKGLHADAIATYEKILNKAAEGGWELSNIDVISSTQQPGCMSGLFGGKAEVISFKMLVFKREKLS